MVDPTTVVLIAVLLGAGSSAWYYGGSERWRALTEDRFVYGAPWGTLLTVGLVVAFYLFAQDGLTHWGDPLTLPFVSWSYFYPLGVLTSGFAHGSPAHLTGNMAGTLAFGVVAEYTWGHYPPTRRDRTTLLGAERGWLARPWIRVLAVVVAMCAAAVVTAVFSFGPGLGFSGAVFAIAGFALVTRPRASVVAVVAFSAVETLYEALADPVVHGTTTVGPPSPPSWASIAFQAHMLGFVLGVVVGVALLWSRGQRRSPVAVFLATLGFGLALSLWLIVLPTSSDAFTLYRGVGVIVVAVLSGLVTVAAGGSDRRAPHTRTLALLWVGLVGFLAALVVLALLLGVSGLVPSLGSGGALVGFAVAFALLFALALPALPAALRGRLGRLGSQRGTAVLLLVAFAIVLSIPGVLYSPVTVDTASIQATNDVTVGSYHVTYAEDLIGGHRNVLFGGSNNTYSGLIVASRSRELWTVAEDDANIAFDGNGSVRVGGLGWRKTVHARRHGWDVTGNESAYVVDLGVGGETTRSFTSDPVGADVRVDGYRFAIVPTAQNFQVRVTQDGSTVGSSAIPSGNETASVGPFDVLTERDDGATELVVEFDGSKVTIAEKETY